MCVVTTDRQTLLSPVIVCGPPDIVFQKQVRVTFQHCASPPHQHWQLAAYSCDMSNEYHQWQVGDTALRNVQLNIDLLIGFQLSSVFTILCLCAVAT